MKFQRESSGFCIKKKEKGKEREKRWGEATVVVAKREQRGLLYII